MKGGTVCRMHGGSASQVREAAALRLARLVHPAIDYIASVVKPGRGRRVDEQMRLRACWDALDRAGLKSPDKLAIASYTVDPKDLTAEQLRAILALREQLGHGSRKHLTVPPVRPDDPSPAD